MAFDREAASERVLDIAEALIGAGGAANLKARSIAEQAGIAVGSVYNLFGDLDRLHGLVNMRLLDRLALAGDEAMARMPPGDDTRKRLLALANAYLAFVRAHAPAWAALLAYSPRNMPQPELAAYDQRLDSLFEIIASVLGDDGGLALGEERRRLAARVLWSSVHGIVTSTYRRRVANEQETHAQIDLLVTTFLDGLARR